MFKAVVPHPLLTLFLAVAWMLLVNSAGPGALLVGLIVGLAIPWLSARFWVHPPRLRRPRVLLRLIPLVLWDIVVANIEVARITLTRPNDRLRPAFVAVPLDLRDGYGITALASIITLTPGTVSALVGEDRRTLYVHALDCDDPEDLVATIKSRYEAPLRELLE
jgi:multicomponent K+:H+ antiporter subunit E